ncbi:TVP38/TMEM64 family protein [Psychrobacillus vulpis]|uniref:TVP38/TMEM64 family membrane protein n=1 Tax=Psychrobacillus vulpis TaxID=2325572 RepID=A0A544TSG1_9BACI|nr:VTT domain-containing protein [Psychrobacillus vulpis]TQR20382.1 TVP38/TMEM64 family protein [Psychrobacillus vulpis]
MKTVINSFTKKQWFLWSVLLFLVLFFIFNQELIMLLLDRDVKAIRTFLKNNMIYSFLFMFFVMLIQNSFTVFPLILVITINISLFGFVNGFLWSWITSILSSTIVFYGARYIFQDVIIEKFSDKLIEKVNKNGFAYVFQARIFPFVPTSIVNILAGLSTVQLKNFLLATAIGNFLYFFLLALIPAGILKADLNEYVIWIVVLGGVLIYYLFKMVRNKRKASSIKADTLD